MALKFGSVFSSILGEELRNVQGKISEQFGDAFGPASEAMEIFRERAQKLTQELEATEQQVNDLQKQEQQLRIAYQSGQATAEEYYAVVAKLQEQEERRSRLADLQSDALQRVSDTSTQFFDNFEDTTSLTFGNVISNLRTGVETLNEDFVAGKINAEEFGSKLQDLKLKGIGESMFALTGDFEGTMQGMGDMVTNVGGEVIGGALKAVVPILGPLADEIGKAVAKLIMAGFQKAIQQIIELNKELINLQRSTGGLASATNLAMDETGMFAGTMTSLRTATIEANVSTQQFAEAIQNLFEGFGGEAMGNIIGAPKSIEQSAEELRSYGIEAARFAKLYGADISGTVRNMFRDFGTPIGAATDSLHDASLAAKAAGLSVKAFVQNLEDVTELAGEIYFADGIEAMEDMAMLATRLGTSVDALASGVSEMEGVVGLFEQQQHAAAMGMQAMGEQMSKVFALRQMGKRGEAARVEFAAMAKDIDMQGLVDATGAITQQGIVTLEHMGATQEQIKAVQRMTRTAQNANLSFDDMMKPVEELTDAQRKRLELAEKENKTFEERMQIATQGLFQSFIDPLADVIQPVLEGFIRLWEGITDFLKPVVKLVATFYRLYGVVDIITGFIGEVFSGFGEIFSDIGNSLQGLYERLEPAIGFVTEAFQMIGSIIGKVIVAPFKLLGMIISTAIDAISLLIDGITWVGDKISTVFGAVVDAAQWVWDAFNKWIIKPIQSSLAPIFEAITEALNFLLEPIFWVVDGLKALVGWLGWFEDEEDVVTDEAAAAALVGSKVAGDLAQREVITPKEDVTAEKTMREAAREGGDQAVKEERDRVRDIGLPKVEIKSKSDVIGTEIKGTVTKT